MIKTIATDRMTPKTGRNMAKTKLKAFVLIPCCFRQNVLLATISL